MHILRLTPSYYWYSLKKNHTQKEVGGAEIQSRRLVDAMREKGIKQTVFTQWVGCPPIIEQDLNVLTPKRYRIPIFKRIRWSFSCIKFAIKAKKQHIKFDGIHIQSIGLISPLWMGCIVKHILKIPLIYSVNCCLQVTFIEHNLFEKTFKIIADTIERWSFRLADAIIFSTNSVREIIIQKDPRLNPKKLYTVGDIIDRTTQTNAETDKEPMNRFVKKYQMPETKKKILYVGRIVEEKGWRTFIEVAEQLKGYPFCFVICGGGIETDKLIKEIEKKHLHNQVILTNVITNQEVFYAMACSDVIVIPSHFEEFGSVVLEAAIQKIPIVASKIRSFKELLKDGRGALVDKFDIDGFTQEILKLLQNESLAQKQADTLYQYVITTYDKEIISQQYKDIYKKVFAN